MQLPLNAMVFFIEDAGDFLKVSYSGTMGYVKREYLRGRGEADSVPMYIANCEEWVSLWEEESTKSERLEKIPLDAPVVAHGRLGDEESSFTLVSYNYRLGYVLNEYLSLLPPKQINVPLYPLIFMFRIKMEISLHRQSQTKHILKP